METKHFVPLELQNVNIFLLASGWASFAPCVARVKIENENFISRNFLKPLVEIVPKLFRPKVNIYRKAFFLMRPCYLESIKRRKGGIIDDDDDDDDDDDNDVSVESTEHDTSKKLGWREETGHKQD